MEIDEPTKQLLSQMGFEPQAGQPKLYSLKIDEETETSVDFRKVNGRRFARRKGDFVDDPDTIPILKAFKEARDKLQSSSTEPSPGSYPEDVEATTKKAETQKQPVKLGTPDTLQSPASKNGDTGNGEAKPVGGFNPPLSPGVDANKEQAVTTKEKPNYQPPTPPVNKTPAPSTFDYIKELVGNDLLEIFGDTGTGKSKFVHALALEAIASGKKVYFLDTERNLSRADIAMLGDSYHYTPVFNEIKNIVLKTLPKCDMVIIDSVGLPILTRFATYSMKERGNALLDLIAVVGRLKEWAYENNALAVVTNQPESEFGKAEGEIRKPFGDKACFAAKEIWLTKKLKATNMTKCSIESFRSRSMKSGIQFIIIEINDSGTKIVM